MAARTPGRSALPSLDDLDDVVAREPGRSTWSEPEPDRSAWGSGSPASGYGGGGGGGGMRAGLATAPATGMQVCRSLRVCGAAVHMAFVANLRPLRAMCTLQQPD